MTNLKRFFAFFIAAIAMATAFGCASTAKHEGTGEYVDDTVITTKVKAAILDEPTLKSAEINVETFKGIVQLSGFVRSRDDINKAVVVAENVHGVKSVKNDMRLK
jgi:osmotically-inducible protein OsmY